VRILDVGLGVAAGFADAELGHGFTVDVGGEMAQSTGRVQDFTS